MLNLYEYVITLEKISDNSIVFIDIIIIRDVLKQ